MPFKRYTCVLIPLLALFLACTTSNQLGTHTPTPELSPEQAVPEVVPKHPLDKSEYRRLVLPNGIKLLLVSDPRFNKSAASLLVGVGSLSNPRNRLGLAHFLEHMLFLGTEKYPGVDDYGTYLKQNGGYNNAFTYSDHTSYVLEINHDAFEGALDRLSQFFIAPLFTETYTERERNAVNSEHQKNLENDGWRLSMVLRTLYRQDHPSSMFSTGNNKTLGGITREELLDFYNAHYSANRMTLALLGKASLDTLQMWAKTHFSPVKNYNLPRITYDPVYLAEKPTFRLIQIEPVKDIRELEIEFPLRTFVDDYESKPDRLLASLIGHEGKGSLLSLLKKEDLATGLSGSAYLNTQDFGGFTVRANLTPKGLENYRDVVRLVLTYIDLVKKSPYPGYYFQEMRSKAKLDELYSDRGEGTGYANALAERMQRYPLDVAERIPYLYEKEDPEAYQNVLSRLRPNNMIVMLTAKGVTTTETEPYYGAQYSYTEDNAFYQTLSNLPARPELHLPEPNPFMPKTASIPDRPQKEGVIPTRILDEPGLVLYYAQDSEFLRPKVSLRYKVRFPKEYMNLRFKVLIDTYTRCVNESLNELAYPARLAGLNYSFAAGYEGVYFSINGFDESASQLFESFLDNMKNIKITEATFEALKDESVRGLKNFPKQNAWTLLRERNYGTLHAVNYTPGDRLPVQESIRLQDVQTFAETLYKKGFIEALVYGNIGADRAVALTRKLQQALGLQTVAKDATFEQTYLQHPGPESVQQVEQLESNNSSIWRFYFMGKATPGNRAIAMVLRPFLSQPFFTELRTNQQLGYVVGAGAASWTLEDIYCYFVIQSGNHPADVLEDRADAFIDTFVEQFEALPQENFETLRTAAIKELKEKEKTIAEKASKFNSHAFNYEGDFERNQKAIKALEALTRADVKALLQATLGKNTRKMRTMLGFAKEHKAERDVKPSFEDLDAWKKTRVYQ